MSRLTIEEHKRLHACCPRCDNKELDTTDMNMWLDEKNRVIRDPNHSHCNKCDWSGMVNELKQDISNVMIDSFSLTLEQEERKPLTRSEKILIQRFMEWVKNYNLSK
jgi:hypothetical protein